MTADDIRKLAERWDSLAPLMHTPEVLRALADVQDAAKFYLLALNAHGMAELRTAVARVEALKP